MTSMQAAVLYAGLFCLLMLVLKANVGRVRTPEPASCHGLSGRPIRGHNIITKKELHAHNTFSNGN